MNNKDGHTPDFMDDFVHSVDERGVERTVHVEVRGPLRAETEAAEPFPKWMNEQTQVAPIQRAIAQLDAELTATRGFDPETGAVRYVLEEGSVKRDAYLKQRQHLVDHELPAARAQGRMAEQYNAERPSEADVLHAELERRAAVKARAQAIVDEREAEAEADKLQAMKRARLGINQ